VSIQQSFVRNNHYLLESTNLALKASTRQQPDRLERLRKFVEQRDDDDDDDTNKSTSCSSIESLLTSNPNKKPRWDQDKHLAVKKSADRFAWHIPTRYPNNGLGRSTQLGIARAWKRQTPKGTLNFCVRSDATTTASSS